MPSLTSSSKFKSKAYFLPQDHFAKVNLTADRRQYLLNRMDRLQNQRLQLTQSDVYNSGSNNNKHRGHIFPVDLQNKVFVRETTSLRDVMMKYIYSNTKEFRRYVGIINPDVQDALLLHTLDIRMTDKFFSRSFINWMNFISPAPGALHNRDVCYLERVGFDLDSNGNEVGFILLESVEIPECPDQFNELHLVRGTIQFAYIFRKLITERNTILASVTGHFQPNGLVPAWLINSVNWIGIQEARFNRFLSYLTIVPGNKVIPKDERLRKGSRRACHSCSVELKSSTKKYQCHLCGEIVCKSCRYSRFYEKKNTVVSMKKMIVSRPLTEFKACAECLRRYDYVKDYPNQPIQESVALAQESQLIKHTKCTGALTIVKENEEDSPPTMQLDEMMSSIQKQKQLIHHIKEAVYSNERRR